MIRCSKMARELDQWITENGYGRFEGYTGKGHLRYRLTNGATFIGAATPTDKRALVNARPIIRRRLADTTTARR